METVIRIERMSGRERAIGIAVMVTITIVLSTFRFLPYRLFAVVAAIGAAALCVRIDTCIDTGSGTVYREYRLLGWTIFRGRVRRLDDFSGLRCWINRNEGGTATSDDDWMVALIPRRGWPLIIRQNPATRPGELDARNIATDISKRTGLPLEDLDREGGTRPA